MGGQGTPSPGATAIVPAPDVALGAQVRATRQARGVSLRSLASTVGVSPSTISQIEHGRTRLSATRLRRIATALDVPVARILDPETDPEVTVEDGAFAVDGTVVTDWRAYAPRQFDPVLQAALEEILEVGYHGATVRGIAQRCGLSVSGLYHYYESKQQMLLTLLELTMTELLQRAEAAVSEGSDPVQRFCFLIEHLALYHTHRRELGFVGASEMRSLQADNRARITAMRNAQQRMVDVEVEQAVLDGRFRQDHPHEAARAMVTMCTALPNWWRPEGPLSAEQVAAQYVGFALDLMRHVRASEA